MDFTNEYFDFVSKIAKKIDKDLVLKMIQTLLVAKKKKGRLFIIGVGGSAGNASHAVNDFRKITLIRDPLSSGSAATATTLRGTKAINITGVSGSFVVDEKIRGVELTESGHNKVEELLIKANLLKADDSLYQASNLGLLHHVHAALRAQHLFNKNVEYIVQGGEAVLIDEHTGRTMPGRRLSEGLHQAIEAKEKLTIQQESQTLASTTFQNYFRLYEKLSGMTGTADTEAYEFQQIYGLPVMVIDPC